MNIPNIRLLNQQLSNPLFREPKELVSWMGAMHSGILPIWSVGWEPCRHRTIPW